MAASTHADSSKKARATQEEIAETLGNAISLNTGAALVSSARLLNAYENL